MLLNFDQLLIDVDSSHMLFGTYCDCLVTNDKRMAEKAKAIYKELDIHTKVITSKELKYLLQKFVDKNTIRCF